MREEIGAERKRKEQFAAVERCKYCSVQEVEQGSKCAIVHIIDKSWPPMSAGIWGSSERGKREREAKVAPHPKWQTE